MAPALQKGRLAVALACAALVCGAMAGSSGASWQPTTPLSPDGATVSYPHVAIAETGDATVVWISERYDAGSWRGRISAARFVDGQWGMTRDISAEGASPEHLSVVTAPNGDATALWMQTVSGRPRVFSVHYAGGAWSSVTTLSTVGQEAYAPALGIDGDGVVTAAWSEGLGPYALRVARLVNGAWTTPTTLEPAIDGRWISVSSSRSSDTLVAWASGGTPTQVHAARFADGAWSDVMEVAPPDGPDLVDVALSPSGVAHVLWHSGDGLFASHATTDEWSAAHRLDAPGDAVENAQIATPTDDTAVATWTEAIMVDPYTRWIASATYDGEGWASTTDVSGASTDKRQPWAELATDGAGRTRLVWLYQDADPGDLHLVGAHLGDAGWVVDGEMDRSSDATMPSVAVGAGGAAAAAWVRGGRVVGAMDPVVPGPPQDVTTVVGANGDVVVSWQPPASNGASALERYVVTASAGTGCSASPPATTCTIAGLARGVAHAVSVVAENAVGSSPAATTTVTVPPLAAADVAAPIAAAPGVTILRARSQRTGVRLTIAASAGGVLSVQGRWAATGRVACRARATVPAGVSVIRCRVQRPAGRRKPANRRLQLRVTLTVGGVVAQTLGTITAR